MSFAVSLLCEQGASSDQACGECHACLLAHAGTHPDLSYIAPEDPSKAIKVDDIRDLCKEFSLTSQFGGYKVVVINHADNMNINASNSLLKTLEEPNEQSILILVTSASHRLPITVRSRCQAISFQTPAAEQANEWLGSRITGNLEQLLSMSHGAPLQALHLAETDMLEQRQGLMTALLEVSRHQPLVEHAAILSKWPSYPLLGWVYDWLSDLLKLIQCGKDCHLINQDYRKELTELSLKLYSSRLYQLLDQVIKLRKVQSIPLNSQMLWEDLLISWEQLLKRA